MRGKCFEDEALFFMILLAQDDACCSKKYVDFSQKTPQLFKQKTYLHV
jgi:hypothetical protein